MAVTIDDVPYVYTPQEGASLAVAQSATTTLIRTLASHRVPVTAFVNAGRLDIDGQSAAARAALLSQWADSGAVLGNHTYSHADFNSLTVEEFQQEILRGEPAIRAAMASRGSYPWFFRHPETHTGDTSEKKEAVARFLATRGYQVAPHTVDLVDYAFNAVLGVALGRNDEALAARLRSAYVEFGVTATAFAERVSPQVFGEEIPQTLLIHANRLNADCLDDLLRRLEDRGYTFVSLSDAMAHPAYRTRDTHVTSYGPTWLWRWAKSKNLAVSFREDPDPPAWVTEAYSATRKAGP